MAKNIDLQNTPGNPEENGDSTHQIDVNLMNSIGTVPDSYEMRMKLTI